MATGGAFSKKELHERDYVIRGYFYIYVLCSPTYVLEYAEFIMF